MFSCKLITILLCKQSKSHIINYTSKRNVQVSVIGASGEVGSNLALLLKRNYKIKKLHLYDDDEKVKGIALELGHIPAGPSICGYSGDHNLSPAIRSSQLVVMVHRVPRKPGNTREHMLSTNAPAVQRLCRTMADVNPEGFLAISTNPLNSIVPFASALLYKYGCYNPFKVLGITHIDTARTRAYAASALQTNPQNLRIPVIGGHSEDTIIPLFSNIEPSEFCVDPCQADSLTRFVRKAGSEVVYQKKGTEAATLAMAWTISEFVDLIIDAIRGGEVIVNSYTANPHFGTRFFSGPTKVGPHGIIEACHQFTFSDYETFLLSSAVPVINRDVSKGEEYIKFADYIGNTMH